jgi:hypothetical protein
MIHRISFKKFTLQAIKRLRQNGKSNGIHSVYSGFNAAAREYYGKDFDVVAAVNKLVEQGIITTRFVKGGAMIYIQGEEPKGLERRDPGKLVKKILGQ